MRGAVVRGAAASLRWSSALAHSPSNLLGLRAPCLSICTGRKCSFHSIAISSMKAKQKVIVISGPTGAGKSRLALELAKRVNGEIISADSVQVYRGLDIGSAKPSSIERKEIPHHLLDILHPSEEYSVGQFYEDARQATKDILDRGRVPIVAGGTGLYLRWYIYGKPDVPRASREITAQVYAELEEYQRKNDWDSAVQLLIEAGGQKTRSLFRNDWYRLRRSLEIIKSSGSPSCAFQVPYDAYRQQSGSPADPAVSPSFYSNPTIEGVLHDKPTELDYDFLCFFLSSPRSDLYRSIDFRCEEMLSGVDGLLSEAEWLLDIGLLPNSNSATRAIGYRQAMEFLLSCRERGGESSVGEFYAFLSEFQKASRNFAKRQMTWFRNEVIYHWIDASRPLEEVLDFVYHSCNNQNGVSIVPEFLKMRKDIRNHREAAELKAYRTKNRYFINGGDCADVLSWIRSNVKGAGQISSLVERCN